jgi:Protein of unknown function (DUF1592)/Protein of unknown function (DUF1595)/Protein of unknown function (DUF1588)/Protein of unknown function (DUF1585)/Protein of unknown function (DUF1587)
MIRFSLGCGAFVLALTATACTASVEGPEADGGAPSPGTGGSTGGSAALPPGATGKLSLKGAPVYSRAIRLTNDQWTHSVRNALALAAPPTQVESFQNTVPGTTDFTNNELLLAVDSRVWSDYQAAAEALAAQVTSDPAALAKVYAGSDGPGFIAAVGRRLYRRPLTSAETASYQKLFDAGPTFSGSQGNFAKGASLVLEAMLQSPHFLYRTELGAAGAALTGYEIASKVSLWLRNSGPDDALLDAAGGGALDTPEGVASFAQQMLEEPAVKAVMRKFHGEFLHFDRFTNLSKVGVDQYDPSINAELLETSYLFFDRIFSQNLGLKEVFLSTKGFVGPQMAALYGGAAPPASGFAEQELGSGRAGYFQQLPFLMLYAHNGEPDSIHRGVSMSLDVLCAPLGIFAGELPPLPPRAPGQTNRVRVDAHTNGCGTVCHNNMINPLGFAFENFDGMGRYRDMEVYPNETLPIDSSGSFDFIDGKKSYQDAADLMQTLASDQQAHLCYSKKLAGYALQRDVVEADAPLLAALSSVSFANSGSLKQVLVGLVKQPAFRMRAGGAK